MKILSAILSLTIFTFCFSFNASAAETEQIGDFVYTADTNEIVDYVGADTEIEIPEGCTLKKLGSAAKKQITKVTINDNESWSYVSMLENVEEVVFTENVTEIPARCESDGSSKISKITLPSTVKRIEEYTFAYHPIEEVNFPEGLEYIGKYAFYDTDLSGDLVFPDSLKCIESHAFASTALKNGEHKKNNYPNITLSDNMEDISRYAFGGYSENINYPASFLDNPPQAFPNAENITFTVSTDELSADVFLSLANTNWYKNTYLPAQSEAASGGDSDFIIRNNVLSKYVGNDTEVVIPDGVTEIAEKALWQLNVEHVTIPDSVTKIGKSAFCGSAIQEITIPKSVEELGDGVFSQCYALKKVVFEGAPKIGELIFNSNPAMNYAEIIFEDDSIVLPDDFYDFKDSGFILSKHNDKTPWGGMLIDYVPDDTIVEDYGMTKAEYLKALANGTLATAEPSKISAPDATAKPTAESESMDKPSATTAPKTTAEPSETAAPSQLTVTTNGGDIGVIFDGKPIEFTDASPFIDENDRTQAPVRAIAEVLGCTVEWDGETQTATITGAGTVIIITIGDPTITVNGEPAAIDTAARIVNDRTYIPVRALAEALGTVVTWEH